MCQLADPARIRAFMRELGAVARDSGHVYFTGGASALLIGWRETTIDVDIKLVPEADDVLRAIPSIKDSLNLNVELASPDDFIPVKANWADQSPFIAREGRLSFHHFDLYAQALAKIERGHASDREDVAELLIRGLVEPERLTEYFQAIAPELYRYPSIDPGAFRRSVADAVRRQGH